MRFQDVAYEGDFLKIRELAPTLGAPAPGAAPGAGATTMAPGQQVSQDPQAQQKMMAQQALDRANQKKEIQELIKQKQAELADLQKQLAAIK
jgi:hypothetical protein